MAKTTVAWDPFAREGLERETILGGECKWCGTRKLRMYRYNGRGPFCDLNCFKAYFGV
jgi:hypothetical protein